MKKPQLANATYIIEWFSANKTLYSEKEWSEVEDKIRQIWKKNPPPYNIGSILIVAKCIWLEARSKTRNNDLTDYISIHDNINL